ncbi:MAG: hypothetical protein R2795_25820 [Saprospiraceae bacterium]
MATSPLKGDLGSTTHEGHWTIQLLDSKGQLVWQQSATSGLQTIAPAQQIPPGIYFCRRSRQWHHPLRQVRMGVVVGGE